MYIIIPTGENITATMTGHKVRDVKCENCGGEYIYLVQAQATGTGSNLMYLDREGATTRAQVRARLDVERQLRDLHYAIPCPECGWYQQHMVRILRAGRLRWLALIAAGPVIWLALNWIFMSSEEPRDLHAGFWVGMSLALAAALAIYHFKKDDNANPGARIAADPTSGGIAMKKADFEALMAKQAPAGPRV